MKRSEKNKLMSLIVPCKNEEGNIENIVYEAKKKLNFPFQLVFIDDLSDDGTKKIIYKLNVLLIVNCFSVFIL